MDLPGALRLLLYLLESRYSQTSISSQPSPPMAPALAPKPTRTQAMQPMITVEAYGSDPCIGIDPDDTEKAAATRRLRLALQGVSQVRHLHRCWLLDAAIGHRQEKS